MSQPLGDIEVVRPLAGGGGSATVDLVRIGEEAFVLKRQTRRHAAGERLFQHALQAQGLPYLRVVDRPDLAADQILLEYVEGSPTIGGSPPLSLCARWGATIASLHAICLPQFVTLDGMGELAAARWPDFLRRTLDAGLDFQRSRGDGLRKVLIDRIADRLEALFGVAFDDLTLVHGDLHLNNALVRDDDIVLFDKAPGVWTAPAVFDLAVIYSEAFPGARYGGSLARHGDGERMAAFMIGYGELSEPQAAWIDHFVLLRALRRYPNPFVPDLRATIEAALARL